MFLSLLVQNKFDPNYVYFNIFTKIGLYVKTSDLEDRHKGGMQLNLFFKVSQSCVNVTV